MAFFKIKTLKSNLNFAPLKPGHATRRRCRRDGHGSVGRNPASDLSYDARGGHPVERYSLSRSLMRIRQIVNHRGVFRYKNTWPLCLQMIIEKKIDVKKLVTHRFPLEQALDAFEVAKSGAGIKVIIDCKSAKG